MPGPRSSSSISRAYIRKLDALCQIAAMIGFYPKTAEDERRNREMVGEPALWVCLLVVSSREAEPYQRAACAAILDFVSRDWRNVSPEILGMIVTRDDTVVRKWRSKVIANDNGCCRHCGSTQELHAHHIIRWADESILRINPANGMTLCRSCHVEEHRSRAQR